MQPVLLPSRVLPISRISILLLLGASSTAHSALARLLSPTARLRQYSTRSTVPVPPGRGFVLKLPGARVDGKPYDMPQIEFNYTYEKVCPPSD